MGRPWSAGLQWWLVKLTDMGRRLLLGRRLASDQLGSTLLPKRIALPVFASDALSSVAYAPDEILVTLALAGSAAFAWSWKIGILVALVMLTVVASYRQTVHAYPSGGGDYEVVTTNLGPTAGLTVASALLVDYVLTVAVSVSSGIQNAKAVIPFFQGREGVIAAVVIVALMLMNMRGVRESGTAFAIPTYCFMAGVMIMVAVGLFRIHVLGNDVVAPTAGWQVAGDSAYVGASGLLMVVLLARAFSSGSAALTGVEAISNGVPNFRPPKSRNAATTLLLLGIIAVSMLLGIIVLARETGVQLVDGQHSWFVGDGVRIDGTGDTVMAQLATVVFDFFPPMTYLLIAATMIILVLAANTAFNGFPTLASILAADGYLPRQLRTRGDRLAYSNGIAALATIAVVLVLAFDADVTRLIQLYVVGVFVSFTFSQLGMMRHWTRHLKYEKEPAAIRGMRRARVINAIGFTMTLVVLVVVLLSKFIHGAWMALLAMTIVFVVMRSIHGHYDRVAEEIAVTDADELSLPSRVHAVVLVSRLHKPAIRALYYAKATHPDTIEAVFVSADPEETRSFLRQWDEAGLDIPLRVLASPYRDVLNTVSQHVAAIRKQSPRDVVCVYIPEYVVGHWWEQPLHNQIALRLRTRLHYTQGVMVTSVPYRLSSFTRKARMANRLGARPAPGTAVFRPPEGHHDHA